LKTGLLYISAIWLFALTLSVAVNIFLSNKYGLMGLQWESVMNCSGMMDEGEL